MEHLLTKGLIRYIEATSNQEPPLLDSLRHETTHTVGMSNMLCGPVEGMLLQMLVKISQAKTCLELGTFTGYSALYMAAGLPVDGKLITCEAEPKHAAIAQRFFDKSPHGHKIEIRLGQAATTIESLDETFDLIFIDADKGNYPLYYEKLVPKLRQNGIMVVDNALRGGDVVAPKDNGSRAIDKLNQMARQDPRVDTVMLSVRDGILLCLKC
ncbi:MAG: class I SAM-dependent methyltransferase [Proteobacteria bacterium]|nr:class I SAM-dependent methyltransferase [Pseudomonadota bacterium]